MTTAGSGPGKPTMPLDEGERRALSDIERRLRREDPALADVLEGLSVLRERHQRLGRRLLGIGLLVAFVGMVTQEGLLSAGALVLGYGLLAVVSGGVLLLRHRFRGLVGERPFRD